MFSAIVIASYALLPAGTPFTPLLAFFWLWQRNALRFPRIPRAIIIVLLGLVLLELSAVSLKGAIQYGLCLTSFVIFVRLAEIRVDRSLIMLTTVIAVSSIAAVIINGITGGLSFMFFVSEEYAIRYRFIFSEPNLMMAVMFLPVIVCHEELRKATLPVQAITMLGLFVTAAAGGSPLGYFGLLLCAINYLLTGGSTTRIVGFATLAIMVVFVTNFLPQNIANRLDALTSGTDNSLNVRTWGSLAIAGTTIQDYGAVAGGIGIGASRQVLDGNPYLLFFGADDISVLPNFVATMLLETGVIGVSLLLCLWSSIFVSTRRSPPAFLGIIFAVANCCSGSYFFDYFSWAAFGLCLGVGHRAKPSGSTRISDSMRAKVAQSSGPGLVLVSRHSIGTNSA